MANDLGTALRADMANAITARIGAGAKMQIRTGAKPATPATADSGTLLVELTLADPAFGPSSDGTLALSGAPQDTSADASGTAGHYRLKTALGEVVMQGTVSQRTEDGGTGDMKLAQATAAIVAGQVFTAASFAVTVSATA